jgi:hypothetical protein
MTAPKVSIILGAGFSYVAGLPLTSELFSTSNLPPVRSVEDRANMAAVLDAFSSWRATNPNGNAESWLKVLYDDRDYPLSLMAYGTNWEHAARFALRQLTQLKNAHPGAYYYGITRYDPSMVHSVHSDFWSFFKRFNARTIISLNYDILVERALHRVGSDGRTIPLFSYGGFPHRQVVRKMTNVTTRAFEDVVLGTEYLIYKLHGSLNWAQEWHSSNLKLHDDVRAVFRTTEDVGVPAIVPPIPEKELPKEFARIWSQAAEELMSSETWVVCGYSMPDYDEALRDWFFRLTSAAKVTRIAVLDPDSLSLLDRWNRSHRADLEVRGFPGLPDALSGDLESFIAGR